MSVRDLIDEFNRSLNEEQGKALAGLLDTSQKIMFLEILQLAKSMPNETLADRVTTFLDWARERLAYCERKRDMYSIIDVQTCEVERAVIETEAATLTAVLKQLGLAP